MAKKMNISHDLALVASFQIILNICKAGSTRTGPKHQNVKIFSVCVFSFMEMGQTGMRNQINLLVFHLIVFRWGQNKFVNLIGKIYLIIYTNTFLTDTFCLFFSFMEMGQTGGRNEINLLVFKVYPVSYPQAPFPNS